ncbi:hypothetical protein DFP94_101474 [Fontibacillus phaseoli]|uniref:Uncharacterized protein n=1 Tax=Fontibacillus phaseoli TaxID=1416533 RepID=A0A369BP84_9BACL|nr:hypothetical protein [Fontibacillus phaseoli]RCX22885.1 hypothetical protein DFP94_101474 [Fontibacillus phaseoli]
MHGADAYHVAIREAHRRGLGGLEKTGLGYKYHGGDAECFRWGNVLFVTASHARGRTFFIYLIDEEEKLFKVYGITGGNPGWTETYGWLHKGTWVMPILEYFRQLERDVTDFDAKQEEIKRRKQAKENVIIGEQVAKFNAMFREVSA